MFKIVENYSVGKDVTFVPNKKLGIYNWFYYKEGYSRGFMEYAYKRLNISQNDVILDPFVGSGTTCLYAKEQGNKCYGFDVNDVAVFAANVKTRDYDVEVLKQNLSKIPSKLPKEYVLLAEEEYNSIKLKVVRKSFPKPVLIGLLAYKHYINTIEEEKYRNFFMLALINTSTITTYAEKHGGSIRINKKRKFPPVKKVFRSIAKRMIQDVKRYRFKGCEEDIVVEKGDARKLPLQDKCVSVVITSPPYLNKIEYTNVYAIEHYLFFDKNISKPAVRSYIGERIAHSFDVFSGKYPMNDISRAYFYDMSLVVKEFDRVLDDGKGAVVIGNGCFPNGVVESDRLFAELLEMQGFKVIEIERVNVRWCMRDRVVKVAPMHESIVWFKR